MVFSSCAPSKRRQPRNRRREEKQMQVVKGREIEVSSVDLFEQRNMNTRIKIDYEGR